MNTFVTPDWVSADAARQFSEAASLNRFVVGETIRVRLPQRFAVAAAKPLLTGKLAIALGVAAIAASPRKVARRSLLGLGWLGRGDA